jgi:hypothetical protein
LKQALGKKIYQQQLLSTKVELPQPEEVTKQPETAP